MRPWQLETEVIVNQTESFTELGRPAQSRRLDYLLTFDVASDGSALFRVTLQPVGFEGGYAFYEGLTDYTKNEAERKIKDFRELWHREVLDYQVLGREGPVTPYLSTWDASSMTSDEDFAQMGLKLAQAGAELFDFLFGGTHPGMRSIRSLLQDSFGSAGRIVAVRADDLHAPWPLMYVQPTDMGSLDGPNGVWVQQGFLGISQFVNPTYKLVSTNWTSHITVGSVGRPRVGLYVDRRLDAGPRECVNPIINYFSEVSRGQEEVLDQRYDVSRVMRQGLSHDVLYILCHADFGIEGLDEPTYALTDGQGFTAIDVGQWLRERGLPNALVFMATCHGGRLGSQVGSSLGRRFLAAGANCLIGPHLEVPVALVPAYSRALFDLLLEGERVGDAMRYLAREYFERYRNPLALSFSAVRGLDTRFIGLS